MIRVVTDSASDFPGALAKELSIGVVPLTVRFGDEEFADGRDLSPREFWKRCESSPVLPDTAAPSPGDFEKAFREAADGGAEGVVCITLSSDLSGTLKAATAAAAALAGDIAVAVVDSRSVSMGETLITLAAARAARDGASLAETRDAAQQAARVTKVYATLDTLENLKKGGRIGAAKGLLGSLLSIKPVIEVRDGAVHEESKQRTRSRALKYLVDKVREAGELEAVGVVHGEAPDLEEFLDLLDDVHPREQIIVGDVGAVIGAHGGPRVLGVTFQPKASP